jgi:hypothetical protein
MHWIAWAAWIVAGVVALVVLGYCAYDVLGKAARLRRAMQGLAEVTARLNALQADLVATQRRAAESAH